MNLLGYSLAARRSRGALLAISVAALVLLSGCLDSSSNNSKKDPPASFSTVPVGEVGGVALSIYNPQSLVYDPFNDKVWLAGVGSYGDDAEITGGVQSISWDRESATFTTEVLFRDDDEGRNHGETWRLEIASSERAYLIGYHGWGSNALYAFNPQSGAFEKEDGELRVIAGLSGLNLPAVERGPRGRLWVAVADAANPRVVVIDPSDHSVVETITGFELNPSGFAFTGNNAVVSTVAPDFSSGAHAVVDLDSFALTHKELDADGSDLAVGASGDGDRFFRLARSNMEYVARYKETAPGTREWEKGLADDTSSDDPNPHDLIFVNADRAYLLMMGEHQHWEVDPSATAPSLFRGVGRLDLSAYGMGDDGAVPAKAHAGVVVDDLLFISMQRWYWDGSATAYAHPYVAVFDVAERGQAVEELDTGLASTSANGH